MKKIIFKPILFSALLLQALISCNKSSDSQLPKDPVQIPLSSDQISLISSENKFAFDLFSNILSKNATIGNVVISPYSVSTALSMTVNGASGATSDSIMKALRTENLSLDNVNLSYKDLTHALLNTDKRITISVANSVWSEKNFLVKEPFINILTTYYDAEARSFDGTDPQAYVAVNSWIEEKTNGLITKMLDGMNSNAVMLLIDAIYFKGKWKYQFDSGKTTNSSFYKSDGTVSQVPMMKQELTSKVLQADGFTMAEIPYGQGNFVMDVIIPQGQETLASVCVSLNAENFNSWIGQMSDKKYTLYFPRFKFGFKLSLKEILTGMGMGLAFNDNADFSNIAASGLKIDDVLHQAFIETNEEGTEAAAATVVVVVSTSVEFTELKLDHPFIYIIRETSTNSILFMGIVDDPATAK